MELQKAIPFIKKYSNNSSWLKKLHFSDPMIVLEKGCPGEWDDYGVRDPAILVNEDGYLVLENGNMVLYYTGSTQKGENQAIGRAISLDNGITWEKDPRNPVLSRTGNGWECTGTSTPWVVKGKDGTYRLYYRGHRKIYVDEAIGLATSNDGIHFQRKQKDPILTKHDFSGLEKQGRILLAVTNLVRLFDGRDLLTFEGFDQNGKCQIFAATSYDRENFEAFNNGKPIFVAENVTTWPVNHVANPRIIALDEPKLYMLTFNGSLNSEYSLGQAFSEDLINWTEHPSNPTFCPTGIPINFPFSGRIEGGVIVKEDLVNKSNPIRMYFMAIPSQAVSHGNAVVGLCSGVINDDRYYTFNRISQKKNEIAVIEKGDKEHDILVVKKDSESVVPPRVIFFSGRKEELKKVSFEFLLRKHAQDGTAMITLGEEIYSGTQKDGVKIRFFNERVQFKSHKKGRNFMQRIINKLLKTFYSLCDWQIWLFCKNVAPIPMDKWNKLSIQKINGTYSVFVNQEAIGVARHPMDLDKTHCLSLQSNGLEINIRSLEKN
jgi:predicted GH43/DUF377 family glycosyl hydrolase